MFSEKIEKKIETLPENSGVYIMKNKYGDIIYVGKAKILKNRITQYFRKSNNHTPKVLRMIENIDDFEYIITNNEMEALILESNLIKKYQPYYNILMRDDKSYPYIKVTTKDEYPKVFITRKYISDGHKYFGPYANATFAKDAVKTFQELYPIAMCKKELKFGKKNKDVCLNYHMGLCIAPCQGNIPVEDYNKFIKEILSILSGKTGALTSKLEKQMKKASDNLDFEDAGKYRDKLLAIRSLRTEQTVSNSSTDNMDILGLAMGDDTACVEVYSVRDKKIVGRENYILKGQNEKNANEVLSAFIKQYYTNIPFIPPFIFIETELEDVKSIETLLSELKGANAKIKVPIRGEKKKLLTLATKNASLNLENTIGKEKQKEHQKKLALKEICEYAKINEENTRFEAYDISNTSGIDSVGVMIVFDKGERSSKNYRKFRIRTIDGSDDYGSMVEVIFRRLSRAKSELEEEKPTGKFLPLPSIIFADGGATHVNAVKNVVDTFGYDIKVLGLVKDSRHRLRAIVNEDGEETKINEFKNSKLMLIQISEEVHRFAIDYHKNLRSKSFLKISLEDIEGIGKVKSKNLLRAFKNLDELKKSSIEEIAAVDGMNEELAQRVKAYFKEE